jgi:hypothetical protein
MSQRYWTGTIGGIELVDGADPAGFELTGAEAFDVGDVTGSITPAADGYPHGIYTVRDLYGLELEVKFLHAPQTLLRALLELFKADVKVGRACSFLDGFQTINASFKPNVPGWYQRGEPDGDYIKDAVLRLICTGV